MPGIFFVGHLPKVNMDPPEPPPPTLKRKSEPSSSLRGKKRSNTIWLEFRQRVNASSEEEWKKLKDAVVGILRELKIFPHEHETDVDLWPTPREVSAPQLTEAINTVLL